jgi:DNA-binding NtrC family response regulator
VSQQSNGRLASVEPARGIRVVLAARDRRFRRVTSFLLGRKGFLIDSVRTTDELLRVVERQRPDVVILDGTDSLTGTTRAIAAIEALSHPVAVLVVAEAPDASSPRSLRLLHKWTPFNRLVDEVERLWADTQGQEVSNELA